ncbi:MAG: DEAD/DEAH box helicase [Candidatus Alkaliphilus sp. MAG34]
MRNKPNYWVFESVPDNEFNNIFNIIDSLLVYNNFKTDFSFDKAKYEAMESDRNIDKIDRLIEIYEIAVIEGIADNIIMAETYQDLFDLYRSKNIPCNDIEKIKFIYRIISYSYLGEQWESGRRYLIENFKNILVEIKEIDTWDIKMFKKTYLAFLYLIKKTNWNDLTKVVKYIRELRKEQFIFEEVYIDTIEPEYQMGRVLELVALYHYAKAVELLSQYFIQGSPTTIRQELDIHYDKIFEVTESSRNYEMHILFRLLYNTFDKMIGNSIWMVSSKVNSRITRFVESVIESEQPIYELMYPQRHAILDEGLLDPVHKAIVVNMPTSSGKTLIAQFRILQALNQFSDEGGWVAYIAPTRALVNQITSRLKRNFEPIEIQVEKMSGAIEIDSFEKNLLVPDKKLFDVLVTTPEKLNLLIRDKIESKLGGRPLVLAVVDEAHNIEDETRGINLEILLSNIKNDCSKANFLLLTPFINNAYEVAKWLDPDKPKDISIELRWNPNDRLIGIFYPQGDRRRWKSYFKTIITSSERIKIEDKIMISSDTPLDITRSRLTKRDFTLAIIKQMMGRTGLLVTCSSPRECWTLSKQIYRELEHQHIEINEDIAMVARYVAEELGNEFILIKLLKKRIGVHHSGLPDEIRYLMEWLMENGELNALIATTTIAQGINFPISTLIMNSYKYYERQNTRDMPSSDFWNLVGRCGRAQQSSMGVVGVVLNPEKSKLDDNINKASEYIKTSTIELASCLSKIVREALQLEDEINLTSKYHNRQWSEFLQFIVHMYNQCGGLSQFDRNADVFLRTTYGYNLLDRREKRSLLNSVKKYARVLEQNKPFAKLSDLTGFSMETIRNTAIKLNEFKIDKHIWDGSNLFKVGNDLKNLIGIMLTIPEIKDGLQKLKITSGTDRAMISNIIKDWVSGKSLEDISRGYFSGNDEDALTDCCRGICSYITNFATWGLSSIQKLSLSKDYIDELEEDKLRMINNLPAMIYYGVDTEEAILMRMNNVPRSIARNMGCKYRGENTDFNKSTSRDVYEWIKNLDDNEWDSIAVDSKVATGGDYKRIWSIIG